MTEFLIREETKSTEYGCRPENRPIEQYMRNGIIVLDKWSGPTSHDATEFIRKKLGMDKAGHAGTLDPAVTGVLPITLENSCKLVSILQRVDKEYIGVIHFHKDVDEDQLKEAIKKFIGVIKQKPPRKSAVSRKIRKRRIYNIEILDGSGRNYCLYVRCEAGTYIRVLFHQLGQTLNTGAHMKELRRVRSGNFPEEDAHKANDIIIAYNIWKESGNETELRKVVIPLERSIQHLKKIIAKDSSIYSIANGSPLYTTGMSKVQKDVMKDDVVAVFSLKNELIAIGLANISAEEMINRKSIAVKISRVIVEKGYYPSMKL